MSNNESTDDTEGCSSQALRNSFDELSAVLSDDDTDSDGKPEHPTTEELAELDVHELRAEYGPFFDVNLNQE